MRIIVYCAVMLMVSVADDTRGVGRKSMRKITYNFEYGEEGCSPKYLVLVERIFKGGGPSIYRLETHVDEVEVGEWPKRNVTHTVHTPLRAETYKCEENLLMVLKLDLGYFAHQVIAAMATEEEYKDNGSLAKLFVQFLKKDGNADA